MRLIHFVPKKEATEPLAIFSQILIDFKFFIAAKRLAEISDKTASYFPPHFTYVFALPWES